MPLHPGIVHFPVGLAFVLPWIVLWLGVALMQGRIGRAGWGLVVSLQAMLVVGALVAASTGENDAELIERLGFLDSVTHDRIEAHEEKAQLFIAFAVLGAIASLVTLRRIGQRGMRLGIGATMLLAMLTLGQGIRVGHEGGEIVYTTHAVEAHRAAESSLPPGVQFKKTMARWGHGRGLHGLVGRHARGHPPCAHERPKSTLERTETVTAK